VVSRVSHCDLRDFQRAAFVGPSEWCCPTVVVLDERDDPIAEFVGRGELAAAQQAPPQDREEQRDLVQPRRVRGREMQVDAEVVLQQGRDLVGLMCFEVVDNAVQVEMLGGSGRSGPRER
jgi:hypothetical protein